ncbi:acyl-CoA dehydrogenase family protein [Zavarzinia sp. CC-PAN008]|uniref:acyl-CoA dehydrogenase family protein n=1 Tax=Zavarzinia sp. CC-PAN008 TaxID=3243332 RepID=UPI003F74A97A
MDFTFSDEQKLLADSVERFIQDDYDFDSRRAVLKSEEGFSRKTWATFAELGWLAIPFSEEDGGLGGGAVETMIVQEAFGKGLVVEPYLSTVVLGGGFIRHGGTAAQKQALIPQIIEGKALLAFAQTEPTSRYALNDVSTKAEKSGSGWKLSGHKAVVLHAPSADKLIVTARTGGARTDEAGITLFLVDAKAAGVTRRDYPTVDGFRASEVTLDGVQVGAEDVIGEVDNGLPLIEQVVDEGIAAVVAEAVGAMKVLNDTTVEYLKTRVQFGQPIGKFQVLQHRAVDMFMNYEQSKSMSYMANLKLGEEAKARKKAISAAKVQIGKSGRFVGQQAVQLHGGMGMTDELNVGHYFKRLTMIDTQFGNIDHHLKRFGSL